MTIYSKVNGISTFTKVNGISTWSKINGYSKPVALTPTYGYFFGGYTGGRVATTDRIVFATSATSASTVNNLSLARYIVNGLSDKKLYGYISGGYSTGMTVVTDKTTFATSTTAASTTSNLSLARGDYATVSDGSLYGYAAGGSTGASNTNLTDRITFSPGVFAANTASNCSVVRGSTGGLSDAVSNGYYIGGLTTGDAASIVNTIDKIVFSTSVASINTASTCSTTRRAMGNISDQVLYGYIGGGQTGGGEVIVLITDRMTFSTNAVAANTVSNLSLARRNMACCSDGTTLGYFAGGNSGAKTVVADKITFATGATSANTASNLSQAREYFGGFADYAV
jgi:hypothetical protein